MLSGLLTLLDGPPRIRRRAAAEIANQLDAKSASIVLQEVNNICLKDSHM
jgi:hypothetical protein